MIIRRITKLSETLCFLLVLSFFLPFCSVMFSATEVVAADRYVKPSAEVVIRTGEGRKYKVIAMVKDGATVELLKEGDSYAMVRLANGKKGWMLKRFLSVDPPLSTVVVSLRTENEKMKQKEIEVTQKFEELSVTLIQLETDLKSTILERDQITIDYQNLQQDTANVIQIKEDMLKATQENEVLVEEMATLKEENEGLHNDKSINWFMAGGGVLLVGMFIGRLTSKSRKRKSSLM
ncbi:MAG: TIGR04211 family SH3 domain-containing protein [Desulforhopalus sp.]|nr:TIGR04211 family SH3 domain-containing protein [Desulforhopalus sp.]